MSTDIHLSTRFSLLILYYRYFKCINGKLINDILNIYWVSAQLPIWASCFYWLLKQQLVFCQYKIHSVNWPCPTLNFHKSSAQVKFLYWPVSSESSSYSTVTIFLPTPFPGLKGKCPFIIHHLKCTVYFILIYKVILEESKRSLPSLSHKRNWRDWFGIKYGKIDGLIYYLKYGSWEKSIFIPL